MRISDWSSDVCSSDLPARMRQAPARPVARLCLARPDLRGRQGLADRHVEAQLPGRRTHLPQLRGLPHQRSEEHTSELQSLMRISYDVFCLKKNNRTNMSPTYQTR